ncbi:MAG: phospholipase D family protein [Saccharofermentanales bacterium]
MNENFSLFEADNENKQVSLNNTSLKSQKIDVVKMDFVEAETMNWSELFEGYDRMYAITYSSGIDFVCELLNKFNYSEIIFGCEEVMSYTLHEIIAFQSKTIERIRENMTKNKLDLISKIDSESLRMYIARAKLSHEKIYLLEADDGRKRTVMGSANMSRSAFSGIKRENICYIDGEKAFGWYMDSFEKFKLECTDNISESALAFSDDGENLEELPIMKTVNINKALVIEPHNDLKDEIKFMLSVKDLSKKISPYMPKAEKNGKIVLSPEIVKLTRRRIVDSNIQDKELRSEYPQFMINISDNTISLNGTIIDLHPASELVKNDVDLFIQYMTGYERFHVDDLTQSRFSQHAIETIKNDDFGVVDNLLNYPAVVISANEDVKAVAAEVIRRTVICRVQAGLKNTELMKSNTVRRVQKNISTAFYSEYLRRMMEKIPELLDMLKDDEIAGAPDILATSSDIIYDIISEYYDGKIPVYVRKLTLEDYFSEKVTGAYAMKTIQNAWNASKKSFIIDKKLSQIRYNAGQTWEVDRILKELPEDLEAHKVRECIVMDLDKACDFFAINFKKRNLFERFKSN